MADETSLLCPINATAAIERLLVESAGEITEEIEQLLIVKDTHLPAKVDAYSLTIARFNAIGEFYKQRADKILRLAKAADAVVSRCKENLKSAMEEMHTDEIVGVDMKFKLVRSNPTCVVENEIAVPGPYKITEMITKIDKKRILEDLKLGVPVEGARLQENFSLREYSNTPSRKKAK